MDRVETVDILLDFNEFSTLQLYFSQIMASMKISERRHKASHITF